MCATAVLQTHALCPGASQPLPRPLPLYPFTQGWLTASGHTVVSVGLNGQPAGLFILDTGASGCVVEGAVANRLGLERFGELHIAAIAGKVGPDLHAG